MKSNKTTWNYRVMEFHDQGHVYREIRIVYYVAGEPESYATTPAAFGWSVTPEDDSLRGALKVMEKYIDAMTMPVLRESDFQS